MSCYHIDNMTYMSYTVITVNNTDNNKEEQKMKKLYDTMTETAGFIYYIDDDGNYRFADFASDVALSAPIDPEKVVWDENNGWQFNDGTDLPWAE